MRYKYRTSMFVSIYGIFTPASWAFSGNSFIIFKPHPGTRTALVFFYVTVQLIIRELD